MLKSRFFYPCLVMALAFGGGFLGALIWKDLPPVTGGLMMLSINLPPALVMLFNPDAFNDDGESSSQIMGQHPS